MKRIKKWKGLSKKGSSYSQWILVFQDWWPFVELDNLHKIACFVQIFRFDCSLLGYKKVTLHFFTNLNLLVVCKYILTLLFMNTYSRIWISFISAKSLRIHIIDWRFDQFTKQTSCGNFECFFMPKAYQDSIQIPNYLSSVAKHYT